MSDSTFHFKQFTINQDKCAMKVGTDAVLLGSWVNTEGAKEILDIGTGTGVIALMLAQKSIATVDAIDIDEKACIQATDNVKLSPWPDKIQVFHYSSQQYAAIANKKYDLIVSNPPYFVDAPKPTEEARTTARHTDNSLSFDELIDGVKTLINSNGRLCIILPVKEGSTFREKARKKGLFCNYLVKVKTKKEKPEKRLLMQFELSPKPVMETELIIQEENMQYTNDYLELTKDFYLGLKEFRNFNL